MSLAALDMVMVLASLLGPSSNHHCVAPVSCSCTAVTFCHSMPCFPPECLLLINKIIFPISTFLKLMVADLARLACLSHPRPSQTYHNILALALFCLPLIWLARVVYLLVGVAEGWDHTIHLPPWVVLPSTQPVATLMIKPRPLAVIRNRRLNSVALLDPLRSVQFSSVHAWL